LQTSILITVKIFHTLLSEAGGWSYPQGSRRKLDNI